MLTCLVIFTQKGVLLNLSGQGSCYLFPFLSGRQGGGVGGEGQGMGGAGDGALRAEQL